MATFGANLRREREMRGVPLEEISDATKISVRCLHALEAEEFSKLPGGIFTRSFIRAYAKYLGLDEEKIMAEFQVLAPRIEEADLSRLAPNLNKEPKPRSRAPLLVLLLGIALLGGGYILYKTYRGRTRGLPVKTAGPGPTITTTQQTPPPATAMGATPGAEKTGAAGGTESGTAMAVATPGDTSKPVSTAGTESPGANSSATGLGLTLQVAATEQTWVAVDADGKNAMQGVLKPNEIQTFKAKDFFDLRTGNAQGIILTLNGETLKPLGRHGEFKKVHLTQNDLKGLTP